MLRFARASDVERIAVFYHSVWHEALARFMPEAECQKRDVKFFFDRMAPKVATTLIAEADGAVAGFCSWSDRQIGQVYVGADHRGRGVAERLLARAEAEMANAGVASAELHCFVGNDRARRFYERQGWRSHEIGQLDVAGGSVPYWRMVKALAV